jgi:poly(A) polymerase/tRNA nucleotidyltransferase (CCA-adding enzyme)
MIIPKEIKSVIAKLKKAGFSAYIVGGCVRDFLRGIEPDDWDITTSAKPEEIQKIFPKNFYENKFLTVTVKTGSENPKLKEIEITTFRSEAKYSDKRHPDEIKFAKTLEEDLARRDFTVNAIALEIENSKTELPQVEAKVKMKTKSSSPLTELPQVEAKVKMKTKSSSPFKIIDPFDGQDDLKNKIIRAVGNPEERFIEDALRTMRAVRFSVTLGESWQIEEKTGQAIKKNAADLKMISEERIRDELVKIIMSDRASQGVDLSRELGLLKYIIPEIEEGYRVGQNKHHIYDCYEHYLKSLEYAVKKNFNKEVRFASLLHDIGKPRSKRGEGQDSTFYNHEVIGARMASQILNRLKFPKKEAEKIIKLVRFHLFYYNVGEVGESSVRRLVRNVGPEYMEELLQVRQSDRIGSGVPKAEPYKLRHLKYTIEKVSKDPISAKMLKINGDNVMKILGILPGPKVGQILDVLLGYVLEEPKKNKKDLLEKEIIKLGKLSEKELSSLSQEAEKERESVEIKKDKMTKEKYWVT